MKDIKLICSECEGESDDVLKEELYSLITFPDDRVGYNALWVFTHFSDETQKWLLAKRDDMIDILLEVNHVGKRRLLLALLENQKTEKERFRSDYLDFCLSKINSTEPYAIRALCLKQSFAQCRFYPELLQELMYVIEMMDYSEMSSGLQTAKRNILRKIAKIKKGLVDSCCQP